jgi:hypothetical protein
MTPHQRLVRHLAAGGPDAADTAHASRCAACRALLSGAPSELGMPRQQRAWLDAAHLELGRRRRPWWALAFGLGAANALLAVAAVSILEAQNWKLSTSPHWLFLSAAAVLALLLTAGAWLALAPARRWLYAALALAVLAPLFVLLAADGRATHMRFLQGSHCLVTVVVLSLLPLAGGAWLLSRVAYSPLRALAVGLVSAAVGLLALHFHCADGASPHLLVFHLFPWAAVGVAAVLLRRLLPTSSYAP